MLSFIRSLFATSPRRARPARRSLGLECLEGRAVPAVMLVESPPIIGDTTDNGAPQTPTQDGPGPNWAPTQPPFTGTMTPTQTVPPNWAPTLP